MRCKKGTRCIGGRYYVLFSVDSIEGAKKTIASLRAEGRKARISKSGHINAQVWVI
jgi:hypothetical protein